MPLLYAHGTVSIKRRGSVPQRSDEKPRK